MRSLHIGIAGGGLLGRLLALAWRLRGAQVSVFDPWLDPSLAPPALHPARAAAWTAAGMLSPTAELECANAEVFALGLRSIALWPALVQTLRTPDQPLGLSHAGSLLLAHRGDEGAAQRVIGLLHAKAPAEHAPQGLSHQQLETLEPDVHGPAHAWLLPHEGHIDTAQAMHALGAWLLAHGVHWLGQAAHSLAPGRLECARGVLRFDHVFDVRGCGARPDLPVRGVRGEVFMLHAPGLALQRPLRLLHPRWRVYIVPRAQGHLAVGATEIESDDRSAVSVKSALELLSAAHSVLPALAEARIVHQEANLRPALPDNLPALHHAEGLTRINGLFRHGWLIGPALVERALSPWGPTPAGAPL